MPCCGSAVSRPSRRTRPQYARQCEICRGQLVNQRLESLGQSSRSGCCRGVFSGAVVGSVGASGSSKRCSGVMPRLTGPHRASLRVPIGPNLNVGPSLSKSIPELSPRRTPSLSDHFDSSPPSVPVGVKPCTLYHRGRWLLTPAHYEPAESKRSFRGLP